jgi:peptide/nickel transport system permease protein
MITGPRIDVATAIALLFVALLFVVASMAPWLAPYGVNDIIGGNWGPPSPASWLGTDNVGRDLLSRLIFGTRTTLAVAGSATVVAFLIGGLAGFLAGAFGGLASTALDRLNDLIMAVPTLIAALVVLSVMPNTIGVLISVMALLDATRVFRVARALATDIAAMEFVETARIRGEGILWVLGREILPNAVPPLLAEFGLRLIFAVLFLSTLSFLGLGIQPPETDWGSLLRENKDGIIFGVWAALIPGGTIALLAIAVSRISDWLQAHISGSNKQLVHG